jgi:TP901 family phage tail tape measure protein
MAKNETAKATIYLDGKQAEAALLGLTKRSTELREALKQAQLAGDQVKMDKIKKELAGVESGIRSVKKETFDYEKVLKNLNGASLKDLKTALRTIEVQMNKMSRTDPGYEKMKGQAIRLKTEINGVTNSMRAQQSVLGRMADGFNKYLGVGMSFIAGIAGVSMTIKGAIQGFNDYEERVANLSSLTGLVGEDLMWLSQQARELGTATLDGGVLVTNGSQAIVDAFTKVGSARPELLKDKEALAEVTKNAMILSAASKEELQPSIEALTMVMNQYNTSADQARRIINVIAAGSKEGAGEIPYITQAFEKAGTVAADAGLSIETLVATIETLAPRITQPEIAGRSLKGVLLDLQAGADDTNPAIVGMSTALENLGKKNLSITELTKMFGAENITTAKILINNVGELKKYEKAVTGTNVALEQGAVNTDTNNARLAQAKERIKQVSDELGGKLAPAYASIISKSSMLLKSIVTLVDFFIKYGRQITIAAVAFAGYTIAVKVAANWTKIQTAYTVTATAVEAAYSTVKGLLTGKIKLATLAQRAWNLALKANPIGLIVGLIAGAIVWLIEWDKKTGKVSEALKKVGGYIIDLANYFIELYNSSLPIRVAIQYIIAMWKTGFEAVKLVVKSLWEELKLGGKLLKAIFTFDFKGIKEALSDFAVNSKKNVTDSAKNVAENWETAYNNAMKGKLKPISKTQDITIKTNGITDQESSGGPLDGGGTVPGSGRKTGGDTAAGSDSETGGEIGGGTGNDKNNKKEDERKNELAAKIKALETANNSEIAAINKLHLEGKVSEDQYKGDLLKQELKFLSDKMAVYETGSNEYAEAEKQYNEKKVAAQNEINDLLLKAQDELSKAKIDSLQDGIKKEKVSEEERWKEELAGLNQRLIDKKDLSEQELAYNDTVNKLIEEKTTAHAAKIKELTDADVVQQQLDAALISQAKAQTDQQRFDAERAIAQAEYKEQLNAAKNNAVKIAQAEAALSDKLVKIKTDELEAYRSITDAKIQVGIDALGVLSQIVGEETALGKALFLMQQAAAIGQIIFNTGIANAKAVAASPLTFGQPWVTINTVSAAISIAAILGQSIQKLTSGKKSKEKETGYSEGGYTPDGDTYQPAGVVHRGEWVAPKAMVKSPQFAPMISWLDTNRKAGNFSRVNIPATGSSGGYATGGFVTGSQPAVVQSPAVDSEMKELLRKNIEATERLMKWKPKVYAEVIKKDLDTLDNINKNRNL